MFCGEYHVEIVPTLCHLIIYTKGLDNLVEQILQDYKRGYIFPQIFKKHFLKKECCFINGWS